MQNHIELTAIVAAATAAATAVTIACVEEVLNTPGPQVLRHPGGPQHAAAYAYYLLAGDDQQFKLLGGVDSSLEESGESDLTMIVELFMMGSAKHSHRVVA
ncbi:hypothetical protein Brms1b_013202 [Colletotrichum noveboracense]|nr:hypothetical protein Brms1b_013202 [Colletotrichum noveboracense]